MKTETRIISLNAKYFGKKGEMSRIFFKIIKFEGLISLKMAERSEAKSTKQCFATIDKPKVRRLKKHSIAGRYWPMSNVARRDWLRASETIN